MIQRLILKERMNRIQHYGNGNKVMFMWMLSTSATSYVVACLVTFTALLRVIALLSKWTYLY